MASEIVKIRSHSLRILLLQSEESFAAVGHYNGMFEHLPELADYKMAQERLKALQTKFEWKRESRGVGEGKASLGPIHTFLQTEWENLAEIVSSLLGNAFQPSKDLSASHNTKSSIISQLEIQADLLQMYQLEEYSGSPPVYCLSAFANPRGFLAALIRETVLIKQSDISHITLHFQVYITISYNSTNQLNQFWAVVFKAIVVLSPLSQVIHRFHTMNTSVTIICSLFLNRIW